MVIHDYELGRTTTGQGMVKDLTCEDLRLLDAGSWFDSRFAGLKVPTLDEVLKRYRSSGILFNIELKTDTNHNQELEKAVLQTIENHDLDEQVIISSFDHQGLVNCRRLKPAVRTGMLYFMDIEKPWQLALSLGCYSVHPLFSYLKSAEIVQAFRDNNLALYPWTVNDPAVMTDLLGRNVQGMITDYPQELKKLISG